MSALPDTPVTLIARMAAQITGEDEAGWVRFFDLYQPVIRHFAQAAGAKADSEDVAQDVLVKLVEVFRQGSYTPEKGRFRSYLATITRREVINRWQKAQARAEGRSVPLDDVELPVPPDAAAMLDAKWRMAQHAAAISALTEQIKDIPPEVMRNDILKPAIDHVSKQSVPGLFAQFRSASVQIEVAKLGQLVKRNKADEPTRRRYAELLASTGDWKAALEVFAKLRDAKAVQAAKVEIVGKTLAPAGDFWWDYKPSVDMVAEAAKVHAVTLYRRAISSGELTGLKKVIAEKRIAEVEATAGANAAKMAAVPVSGGNSNWENRRLGGDKLYCVVDLSAGPNAAKYPVKWLSAPPSGGFNTDEYKTTKLVLRRIEPGKFKMCGQYDVTLTKPFCCGIFEVTQKQYELVTGSNPSKFKGDMRPVEVSWNMARGDSSTYNWPSSANVNPNSFMGKIQTRTGLYFDLPTEAQWEYACRAGTTSEYSNGDSTDNNLKQLGRYRDNQSDGKGGFSDDHTAIVGSYLPNAWGIYDMYGNVVELCLDWRGELSNGVTDPVGASTGDRRVLRGGSCVSDASSCSSSNRRMRVTPWSRGKASDIGFRLALTLSGK